MPVSITQYATPYLQSRNEVKDFGFFVQDQWTIKRLTLNYGLRFEYFNGSVPAQHVDATPNGWVPARDFAEVNDVPLWKDWDPRLGAAYDLFGDGRTAVKVALGRYRQRTAPGSPTPTIRSRPQSIRSPARGTTSTGITSRTATWRTAPRTASAGR